MSPGQVRRPWRNAGGRRLSTSTISTAGNRPTWSPDDEPDHLMEHKALLLRSLLLGAFLLAPLLGPPARADTAALVPHRGIYDIGLKSAQDRSGITSAQGRMVIEVQGGSCEGWTVDFRMVNQFMTEGGTSRLLDVRSSSWESPDGKEMHYNERQFVDNA